VVDRSNELILDVEALLDRALARGRTNKERCEVVVETVEVDALGRADDPLVIIRVKAYRKRREIKLLGGSLSIATKSKRLTNYELRPVPLTYHRNSP